jgi:hypothetical protein
VAFARPKILSSPATVGIIGAREESNSSGCAERRRADAMNPTFSNADASAGSKMIEKPVASSTAMTARSAPIWPKVVVATGLLAALAWTVLLAWVVLRIFGVL